MNLAWNDILWRQTGASMDMLENALHAAQLNLFLGQQAGQSAPPLGCPDKN